MFRQPNVTIETLSGKPSNRSENTRQRAAEATAKLFGYYPPHEVSDPKAFLAAVTAIFEMYPEDVVARVIDPLSGLPSKQKFAPKLAEIKEACEDHYRARRYTKEWNAGARKQAEERLEIPDYRPKPMHAARQYTYGEYMEITGWKGRPIGRFEIKSEFAKEGESKEFVEPKSFTADELKATDALLATLAEQVREDADQQEATEAQAHSHS